jgi:hypothetical protein
MSVTLSQNRERRKIDSQWDWTPVAEKLRDLEQLKALLSLYERKYDYDMATMRQDILELREPIFAVRPSVAFGLDEEAGMANATRWRFAP